MQAAGWVYLRMGGEPGSIGEVLTIEVAALIGAATTYFLFNTVLISVAIALSTRQPWMTTWNENFLWSAPSYFVGAAGAFVTGYAVLKVGPWFALLMAAPVYFIYRTYKVYLGRIEDERRHVQEMSDLHLATIEALALAIDAKDQTAQSHIRRVQVYAAGIAKSLGMPDNEIQGVKIRHQHDPCPIATSCKAGETATGHLHARPYKIPIPLLANDSLRPLRVCHVWPDQLRNETILSTRSFPSRSGMSGTPSETLDSRR